MALAVENSDRPSVLLTWADACAFRYILVVGVHKSTMWLTETISALPILHFLISLPKGSPLSLGLAMRQVKDIFGTLYQMRVASWLNSDQWDVNGSCSEGLLWAPKMRASLGAPFCPSVFPPPLDLKLEHEDLELQQPGWTTSQPWRRTFEPSVAKKKEEGF